MGVSRVPLLLVVIAACMVILSGLVAAKSIVIPVLLAVFFSILFSAFQGKMLAYGLPGWLAVPLTIFLSLVFFVLLAQFFTSAIRMFIAESQQLSEQFSFFFDKIDGYLPLPEEFTLQSLVQPGTLFGFMRTSLNTLLSFLNNMLLIVLLVLFMLIESAQLRKKLARINSTDAVQVFDLFASRVKRYMVYKSVFSAITGLAIGAGLSVLSVEHAVLWGFVAFLLNFIPAIGSVVAAVFPLLLTLTSGNFILAAAVGVLYASVNIVVGNVLEPRYMGKGMGLSALAVFLSLIFWGWVFGVVGMFLSVPLTMVIKIALESSRYKDYAAMLDP